MFWMIPVIIYEGGSEGCAPGADKGIAYELIPLLYLEKT